MGKVIKVDFGPPDNSGYMIDGDKVTGVYMGDLVANKEVGSAAVCVFDKSSGIILFKLNADEMNRFCFLWLNIFDPDVIKEEV